MDLKEGTETEFQCRIPFLSVKVQLTIVFLPIGTSAKFQIMIFKHTIDVLELLKEVIVERITIINDLFPNSLNLNLRSDKKEAQGTHLSFLG